MSEPCQECQKPAKTCPGCGKHLCAEHDTPKNHGEGCTEYANE